MKYMASNFVKEQFSNFDKALMSSLPSFIYSGFVVPIKKKLAYFTDY